MANFPMDLAFPTYVNYPGSPSTPDAAEMNRLNNGIINLSNPPSAKWQATNTQLVTTSPLTLTPIFFDTKQWQTDDAMTVDNSTGTVGSAHYKTDRIFLPYPGEWHIGAMAKTQTNNNAGVGYMVLSIIFNDGSSETDYDADKCDNNVVVASFLHTSAQVRVTSAHVAKQICCRVKYAQNSGGTNALVSQDPAWPCLYARWLGTLS
jgi:hypothetical protein